MATNPYAASLDGLDLPNPVEAFFNFCRERENVRMRRERGDPAPWSSDPIFRKGRFLNVFREDDRTTLALLRFVEAAGKEAVAKDPAAVIQLLFFARWCNRDSTLEHLREVAAAAAAADPASSTSPSAPTSDSNSALVDLLRDKDRLAPALASVPMPPWDNITAYPVEPVRFNGQTYGRHRAAVELFADPGARRFLLESIRSAGGDVIRATANVNAVFRMQNDFPIFMAVMDVAFFFPSLVNPASHVPVGIGAVPFLARLRAYFEDEEEQEEEEQHRHLRHHEQQKDHQDYRWIFDKLIELQPKMWPEAKRALMPIDVEYLCCECRKYYSYKNGTKTFDGKNVFKPGQSPTLEFVPPKVPQATKVAAAKPLQQQQQQQQQQYRQHRQHRQHRQPVFVIAGGPCSGKTSLLRALEGEGHVVVPETAEQILREGVAAGRDAEAMRQEDPVAWQMELLEKDFELFDRLLSSSSSSSSSSAPPSSPLSPSPPAKRQATFTDTSFVETAVFSARAGITLSPAAEAWMRAKRYTRVFFLSPLNEYEQTSVRIETEAASAKLAAEIREAYEHWGYRVTELPAVSVAQRKEMVLATVAKDTVAAPSKPLSSRL